MFLRGMTRSLSETNKDRLKRVLSLVPPSWRQGRSYWRWRHFLHKAQYWSPTQIKAWQLDRLRKIVRHATDHTEGYRELYRTAGLSADDLRSVADIRHFPCTTKTMLQDNLEAFSVRQPGRLYVTTGGSTGIPFGFYETDSNRQVENAFIHTAWLEVGWRLGMWSAVLRGGFVGTAKQPWKRAPYSRELSLSSYFLTPTLLHSYVEALRRYQPPVLQAYPSSLNVLCDLLKESGQPGAVHFDLILLGSENVYDWQLAKARDSFPRSRIFAWYGHAEKAILAPWCAQRAQYHAWPYYGLTEIVDPDGRPTAVGGEGELVGTSFHNFVTPFIRYRTLDRALRGQEQCDLCGRHFQLLSCIVGRAHEMIVTGTGRFISMTAINMHDDIFDLIRQFQFVQEAVGEVVFQYVPRRDLTEHEVAAMRARLMVKLGDDMHLKIAAVNEIPRAPSGKYRFLEQRLPLRYGDR
jgi:phenylacetate-CoA ligase